MSDSEKPVRVQKPGEKPFLGHSIRDRKIRYSSVSQITYYDRTWPGGCPAKYAYQYLPQIVVPPPYEKRPAKTKKQTAGNEYAENLRHYLTSGENVLGATLQEAKKFLPEPLNPRTGKFDLLCETPLGPDIKRAVELRDDWLKPENEPYRDTILAEIKRCAGLTANGVPIDGAWDYSHFRGEYVDEDGILKPERDPEHTFESADLKSTSRINPQQVMKGANRGTILPGYAKTRSEILGHPQNLGYGVAIADANPSMRYGRLGNVYVQTTKKYAEKRTGILHVDEIRERWRKRGDAVMAEMEQVAAVDRIEQVEGNLAACDAYTHVDPQNPNATLQGCGHRYYCPHFAKRPNLYLLVQGGSPMSAGPSLFSTLAPDPAHVPPSPPAPPQDRDALVAAEREQLLALERGAVSPPLPPSPPGAMDVSPPSPPAPPSPPDPPILGILPPDAPRHASMLDAAGPIPAAAVAEIEDPEIRAAAEEHNRLHAERSAAEAASAPKKVGGRCPGSGQVVQITVAEAMRKKVKCPIPGCGMEKPIPKEIREAQETSMPFPGHNVPKLEVTLAAGPPAPPEPPSPPDPSAGPPSPPDVPSGPSAPEPPVPPEPPSPSTSPSPKRVDLRVVKSRSMRDLVSVRAPNGDQIHLQESLTAAGFVDGEAVSVVLTSALGGAPPVPGSTSGVSFSQAEADALAATFRDKFASVPRVALSPLMLDVLRRLRLVVG